MSARYDLVKRWTMVSVGIPGAMTLSEWTSISESDRLSIEDTLIRSEPRRGVTEEAMKLRMQLLEREAADYKAHAVWAEKSRGQDTKVMLPGHTDLVLWLTQQLETERKRVEAQASTIQDSIAEADGLRKLLAITKADSRPAAISSQTRDAVKRALNRGGFDRLSSDPENHIRLLADEYVTLLASLDNRNNQISDLKSKLDAREREVERLIKQIDDAKTREQDRVMSEVANYRVLVDQLTREADGAARANAELQQRIELLTNPDAER